MSDERRPGIHVDEEDLDQGFKIANTVFRIDGNLSGPCWTVEPDAKGKLGIHEPSTLTRDAVLIEMDRALALDGDPQLAIRASADIANEFLSVVREVLAESIRRGWLIEPRPGEAVTFDAEHGHAIDGLTGDEAGILQHVLDEIRDEPGGAVITLGVKEKDQHRLFVEAISDGALPVYLRPEDAAKAIRRLPDGTPILAFGRMPDPGVSDTLAVRIDAAIRAEQPLRTVEFEGPVKVEIDDTNENADLPDQPVVGGDIVARCLEDLDGSVVRLILTDGTGSTVHIDGELGVNAYGSPGDEVEPSEPPEITVGAFDLRRHLEGLEGHGVSMSIIETKRPDDGVADAAEGDPKTPEEDVVGKVRVALSSAKLIAANHEAPETRPGEPEVSGAPSRENSLVVTKLDEALMWAERDTEAKGRPRG